MPRVPASAILALLWLTLFCQCRQVSPVSLDGYGHFPMTEDAGLLIDSSMSFMRSDPAKAHQILDSLLNARKISPLRCDS